VSPEALKRQSAAVTRQLRLLRAHGLIQKVARTHRYVLNDKGRHVITGLVALRHADTTHLLQAG
jgi:predicted transcriptional regulator